MSSDDLRPMEMLLPGTFHAYAHARRTRDETGRWPSVRVLARIAAGEGFALDASRDVRVQLALHAAGGLVVLLTATTLSVYKPWGPTPYGLRRLREQTTLPPMDVRVAPPAAAITTCGSAHGRPRWTCIIGFHALGLALLFVILHLCGVVPHHR